MPLVRYGFDRPRPQSPPIPTHKYTLFMQPGNCHIRANRAQQIAPIRAGTCSRVTFKRCTYMPENEGRTLFIYNHFRSIAIGCSKPPLCPVISEAPCLRTPRRRPEIVTNAKTSIFKEIGRVGSLNIICDPR
ncbi:uncharacterized protein CIMG_13026 [Coccidioides immitis RS]|uniref:Uncharacterized protein n=1 Tax=Coccidioides immitis (strain RS) TaxID=246410 RepID=A0A0D8JU92_COCIM|nr:uncharacterized protein CIMG_13026 [Coccidioides immitis RS]KJF60531.1 hypothetical protein CIMG_13026 [Coccidioides immitis RS]